MVVYIPLFSFFFRVPAKIISLRKLLIPLQKLLVIPPTLNLLMMLCGCNINNLWDLLFDSWGSVGQDLITSWWVYIINPAEHTVPSLVIPITVTQLRKYQYCVQITDKSIFESIWSNSCLLTMLSKYWLSGSSKLIWKHKNYFLYSSCSQSWYLFDWF